jgi:hypothetical protein
MLECDVHVQLNIGCSDNNHCCMIIMAMDMLGV